MQSKHPPLSKNASKVVTQQNKLRIDTIMITLRPDFSFQTMDPTPTSNDPPNTKDLLQKEQHPFVLDILHGVQIVEKTSDTNHIVECSDKIQSHREA